MLAQTHQSPHASGRESRLRKPCRSSQRAKLLSRHFSFCELFLFVPIFAKRKSGLTVWVSLSLWVHSRFETATRSPAFFDVIGAKKAHKDTPHLAGGAMRLRARDGEARDFLKTVAQKLLISGCSALPPPNTIYINPQERAESSTQPFGII